jgi:hypothetical protein
MQQEQQQRIQEISSTLIRQIQTEKQNTTTLLTNMLTQRNLNNQFELLLSKLGENTPSSPARSKTTPKSVEGAVQQQSPVQLPLSCDQCHVVPNDHTRSNIYQPVSPTFISQYNHTASAVGVSIRHCRQWNRDHSAE